MEILNHPFQLFVVVILSLISFVLTYAGMKSRNLVWVLYGIATGIPPVDLTNINYWLVAGVLAGVAYWLSKRV